jgi:hypothetical protein
MNKILRKYLNVFCIAYLNDILMYNRIREKHLSHVRKVLESLKQAGLYCHRLWACIVAFGDALS